VDDQVANLLKFLIFPKNEKMSQDILYD
jgi:hypothetical protein